MADALRSDHGSNLSYHSPPDRRGRGSVAAPAGRDQESAPHARDGKSVNSADSRPPAQNSPPNFGDHASDKAHSRLLLSFTGDMIDTYPNVDIMFRTGFPLR